MTNSFSSLTPDRVLDAPESLGLLSDGRLLALNSYENRVPQVDIEDDAPLVAKFYRPARWSDAAILEEHDFVQELAEREIPVVPALNIGGNTLHRFEGFRFAVFPKRGGRAPELEDRDTLEWMGRFLGRIHAIGALKPFTERAARLPARARLHSARPRCGLPQRGRSGAGRRAPLLRTRGRRHTLRLHGDCHAVI